VPFCHCYVFKGSGVETQGIVEKMRFKSFSQLKQKFAENPSPDIGELHGYYAVKLVTGFLPPMRFFGHRKFFPVDVADPGPDSGGFNEFLSRIRIGCFMIEPATSILGDGQQVLRINYNRPGNPFWLRPLNDELKKVGRDRYLGRGVFRLFGLAFNSFYFSVERESLSAGGRNLRPDENMSKAQLVEPGSTDPTGKDVIQGKGKIIFNGIADAIIPRDGVFKTGAADYDLVPRVNAYLATVAPVIRRLTPLMLRYVELASLCFNGRRFSRLSPSRAQRFLERMEGGRLLYHRHIILFLKLLVMTAFYERQIPAESIGYVHGCHLDPDIS
jgi:hypothetical protein